MSRMGVFLFAFFFSIPLSAQQSFPDKCGFGQRSQSDRIIGLKHGTVQGGRPLCQTFADSKSGRFRVHFDTSGVHAVDMADLSGNGLPDYVDECHAALEHAWLVEIDTLGYLPPPADGTDGGSAALDVYVRDLGPSGYYGVATPDRLLRLTPTEQWTSFMEIDNDYSAADSSAGRPTFTTTGLDALRITCAHEFHHTVQNGCYALVPQHRMLYELTSTWMEMRCWPEVRDWAYYATVLLERSHEWPLSRSSGRNGYVWGWFGNVLAPLPGNVLRSMWERIGQGRPPYAALVEACKASGTEIDEVFCTAVEALCRTGVRGSSNAYLPGASQLPELTPFEKREIPLDGLEVSRSAAPFAVILTQLSLTAPSGARATADVVLASNSGAVLASDTLRERPQTYRFRLTSEPTAGDVPISSTGWGVRLHPTTPDYCLAVDGIALIETDVAFPQPLDRSGSRTLYVPVGGVSIGSSVSISILDLSMQPVQPKESVATTIYERRVVAEIEVNRDIAPGTYLLYVDDRQSPPTMQKIFIR
ncbi:MAG: hypothetical protein FGM33_01695 [Candidatus Kapabacteria bacterium]|nr:hypothetical protein [Candidatus Kapabacteria bacterium]